MNYVLSKFKMSKVYTNQNLIFLFNKGIFKIHKEHFLDNFF